MSIDDDKEIAAEIRPKENIDRQAGAREEREAVVRWLRAEEKSLDHPFDILAGRLADEIEAGEHRKEADHG